MRLRTMLVQEGGALKLKPGANPSPEWLADGLVRWLNVEGATREELEQIFNQLGAEGRLLPNLVSLPQRWKDYYRRQVRTEVLGVNRQPELKYAV